MLLFCLSVRYTDLGMLHYVWTNYRLRQQDQSQNPDAIHRKEFLKRAVVLYRTQFIFKKHPARN